MKTKSMLVAAWIVLVLASGVRAEFVPGHVFVAESTGKQCMLQAEFGGDLIWEIDPQSGVATLFAQIPEELCGFITGLVFTPDGNRLRASMWLRSEIIEFDSLGNMTVALDFSDGIVCPWGFNNLAYDADGNFYVLNQCTLNILRFPAEGGPPTVFADTTDGIGAGGSIAFATNGDLYFTTGLNGTNQVRSITTDGKVSILDSFFSFGILSGLTTDASGHIYAGCGTGEVFRYTAGDPGSKELLTVFSPAGRYSIAMSPDQTQIYVNTIERLLGIDVVDGAVTTLAEFDDAFVSIPAGIAVVPPAQIPTLSEWSLAVMTLFLLTTGAIIIQRRHSAIG